MLLKPNYYDFKVVLIFSDANRITNFKKSYKGTSKSDKDIWHLSIQPMMNFDVGNMKYFVLEIKKRKIKNGFGSTKTTKEEGKKACKG